MRSIWNGVSQANLHMDRSGKYRYYPSQLGVIMEESWKHHSGGLVAENFNVEFHGNSVDTHYHHGALEPSMYRSSFSEPLYHYDYGRGSSYRNSRLSEGAAVLNNIEFHSTGPQNIKTDFRAHLDYQVVPVDHARNAATPENFQYLIEETTKEIEEAATAVDNLGYNFTQDVKKIFNNLSSRLQENHSHWIDEVSGDKSGVAAKDEAINNLTEMLEKEKENHEMQNKLNEWQVEALQSRHEEFNTTLADKFHTRNLKQKVFNTLRANMMASWKKKCEDMSKKRTDDVCNQLKAKYSAAQEKLEEEIANLRQEQMKLAQEKSEYEAAIQQGLMKGLCSLNMEAMKVFKLKMDSSTDFRTLENTSQESHTVRYDPSQPHITREDSENPVGLTPSLVVILENSKDKDKGSDVEDFVSRSARPNRTVKKNDSDQSQTKNKRLKNIKLPPNYQVIKVMKKPQSVPASKKK